MSPFDAAREAFNRYAAMDHPDLPEDPGARLQVLLYRWTQTNVARSEMPANVAGTLGMAEELGEAQEALNGLFVASGRLSHLALNHAQGRRGYASDMSAFRSKVADALADHAIFAHQLATSMRLDYWTLVRETAIAVMKRNWKTNPLSAHLEE